MGANTEQVLQRFQAAEQGKTPEQMTKEAAEVEANRQIGQMFLQAMYASGQTEEGLKKYAQENPQGYEQLFNEWLVKAAAEAQAIQEQQALEKQAEAEKMQKIAEDIMSGRIMAYAFVDELGNIFHELQKQAEAEGPGKDETPAHEKVEGEKPGEEKKDEKPAEEKKEEGGGKVPPQFLEQIKEKKEEAGEKKEGSAQPPAAPQAQPPAIPVDVMAAKLAIEKKASAGYPVSPQELDFLSNVKLAEAGYPVKWN